VTRESPPASRPEGHPDAAQIAAHADRRLSGAEAARMDEHVAGCPDCYEVFAATVEFGLAEPEAEIEGVKPAEARLGPTGARLRSPLFTRTVGLAAAAALVVALGLWFYRTRSPRASAPLVAQLAEAMGTHRFIEPRLTGGFRHGRLITLRSGEAPQGLDAQPGTVLAAVARIRERAEGDTSPEALGALGVTYLVSGDAAAAVKSLESASAQKPEDAGLLSDLSAAYLVRARQADEPADIPKALEAAERAVALPEPPPEAYFNRALALESLHLVDAARKAWQDYLDRDSSSAWADEARQHLDALSKVRRSSVEEDKARVRAAIEGGPAAIDRLTEDSPSLVRAYFEDELLPAWADADLVGHPDASLYRERARLLGEALFRTTNDPLPQEAARALASPAPTATSRDPLRSQALGYHALREAKRLSDRAEPSCGPSRDAARDLDAGASPYAGWARVQVVSACLYPYPVQQEAALVALARLETLAQPRQYIQLLGRIDWLQGLIHAKRAELTESLEQYRSARASFQSTRDAESEALILTAIAENLHHLGEAEGSWRDRVQSLALLDEVRSPRRRHGILSNAVFACLADHMPRSALQFGIAYVDMALAWAQPFVVGEALIRRAGIHHALGDHELAASDLRECRKWILRVPDASLAQWLGAEADTAEGRILIAQQPAAAALALDRARAYVQATAPSRAAPIHLLLARAHMAQGLDDRAEADLRAGIEELERQRTFLRDADLQVPFFDQASALFDDMVRLQVETRHDPQSALAFVERSRARQLVDSMVGATGHALDPEALRRELPEGLALVYYVPVADRLFVWTLTREGLQFIERSLPAAELSHLVAAYLAAIQDRAPEDIVRRSGARVHDRLVRPIIPFIASQRALVFIPHGVLQSVPFAGLWNSVTSRYLVQDYLLGVAPSGTVFVRASTAAGPMNAALTRALVVGNPQVDRRVWAGLANLPAAEVEAEEIARLYPRSELLTGSAATKAAFLDGARVSQVVHYAGHAASSAEPSFTARLLFARDPHTGDSGALDLHDVSRGDLPRTRVVVLAACRTAAGRVSRVEGALSLGRPFLATGVPDVVASLWDIDDSVSRQFFVVFHRALLAEGDPSLALRKAQLVLLKGEDATLAHPASWAAFICMGGFGRSSLLKGDAS
jgi:CHAT domain-containing protein